MELAGRFLLDALAHLERALGFLCYVLLKLAGSPSGRYAPARSAFRLRARAAWAGQQLPSLAVPLLACAERLSLWPDCILLTMFLIHYAQRSERPESPQSTHHSLSLLDARQAEKLGVGRGEAQQRPVQMASGTCSSLVHQVTSLAGQGTGGILKEQAAGSPMKGTSWRPSAGSTKVPQGSPPISGHSP
ncbi:hypothetical protein J1605_010107 [Eschrichtius robustus]|uniref:Uncharacterized protein n=1 Tax=Eschrichtius robustus TaxID=9764 RepID=A0AB34GSC6_ESCRO|nr:hypothetical protein J1605_010107 [Eschrichtius robustus]